MYYLIENTLREHPDIPAKDSNRPYVAILSPEQWQKESNDLDLGIDMDFETLDIHTTMAEVNYNSITGSFAIPYINEGSVDYRKFAYVINEDGIIFIDDNNVVSDIVNRISLTRKWRMPSLERFIYDFLEEIIASDLSILEDYEKLLAETDKAINSKEEVTVDCEVLICAFVRANALDFANAFGAISNLTAAADFASVRAEVAGTLIGNPLLSSWRKGRSFAGNTKTGWIGNSTPSEKK